MTLQMDLKASRPICPWLPEVKSRIGPGETRRHGSVKGTEFYRDALRYAQSLWLEGKPAQAILQLNKSWMAEAADEAFPPPYRALVWMMERARAENVAFMGNPVRHFQHLASRMSGPRAEIRSWRAWVCFHLAGQLLDHGYPRDGRQIAREGIWIPSWRRSLCELERLGWTDESMHASQAMTMGTNLEFHRFRIEPETQSH